MKTLKKWTGIALFSLLTSTSFAFTGNGNNGSTNSPNDLVIVSMPAPEAPEGRKLIAIRAIDIADYIKKGAFVVPFSDEVLKIIGFDDSGTH